MSKNLSVVHAEALDMVDMMLETGERPPAQACMGPPGTGKAQPLDAPILTPNGWVRMGDIVPGDEVIGVDGHPTRVLEVYPQGVKDIYRVHFSDGSTAECCEEHLWNIATSDRLSEGSGYKTLELREFKDDLTESNGKNKWRIPMVSPVNFSRKEQSIDPYLLGALLGDGDLSGGSIRFSNVDQDIIEKVASLLPSGLVLRHLGGPDHVVRRVTRGNRFLRNELNTIIKGLGLKGTDSFTKFIPNEYLFGDVQQRLALLQGIMDTDGSVSDGHVEFSTSSEPLLIGVVHLVESLGGTAIFSSRIPKYKYLGEQKEGHVSFRVSVKLPKGMNPFSCKRKAESYGEGWTKYGPVRIINGVEPIGKQEAQCIRVESSDGLYVTDRFVVTHNTHMYKGIMDERPELKWLKVIQIPLYPPEDLRGFIELAEDEAYKAIYGRKVSRSAVPTAVLPASKEPGILVFDDFNVATPGQQAIIYRVIHEGVLGEFELPKQTFIALTGNGSKDKAVANRIPSTIINRVQYHDDVRPDADLWLKWAGRNGMHLFITSFIGNLPHKLYEEPKADGPFTTPRSLELMNRHLSWKAGKVGLKEAFTPERMATYVGQATAEELWTHTKYERIFNLVHQVEAGKLKPTDKEVKELGGDEKYILSMGVAQSPILKTPQKYKWFIDAGGWTDKDIALFGVIYTARSSSDGEQAIGPLAVDIYKTFGTEFAMANQSKKLTADSVANGAAVAPAAGKRK